MKRRIADLVAIFGVLAILGFFVWAEWGQQSPPPKLTVPAPACAPSPQAAIADLPAGGTFVGSGCYSVPNGLHLTKPVTIDGGSYVDSSTVPGVVILP